MPHQTGQLLNNRYRIVKPLGQGGFGAVYRAWDLNLNIACAVKENLDLSPVAQKQFTREAEILSRLHHPNLPRVTDHFQVPGMGQYLVMDYVEGEHLGNLILHSGGALDEKQVLNIIGDICDALSYLHGQKPPVIHRDIKPQNIILTPSGKAMLVDFGIAKMYDPTQSTTMGARAYTPGYSPPEQYGKGGTDARSDVYALGATIYTCLTGQEPIESIQRTLGAELTALRVYNPAVSPGTEHTVLKALAIMPDQRYQSIDEFWSAMQGAPPISTVAVQQPAPGASAASYQAATQAGGLGAAPAPAIPGRAGALPQKTPWMKWLGGVLLVMIVLAGAFIIGNSLGNRSQDSEATPATQPVLFTDVVQTPSLLQTTPPTPSPSQPLTETLEPSITPTLPPPTSAVATLAGDGLVRLTFGDTHYYKAVLSPDQRHMLAFAKIGDYWQIVEIDPNGGGVLRQITSGQADYHHPQFTADGQSILAAANLDGYFNIYVIDFQTGAVIQQLTQSQCTDMTPSWFPGQSQFAFMSNCDGDYEIYLGNVSGAPAQQLTSNTSYDGSSSVSPDGRHITFYSNRSDNPEIYLLELGTDQLSQLTSSSARDAEPAFSPDGQWIAFESNREGNYDIWVIHPDGSGLQRVTSGPANEQVPVFSPDGQWLLYMSDQDGYYDIFRIPWQ